jgi:hypothetical protein
MSSPSCRGLPSITARSQCGGRPRTNRDLRMEMASVIASAAGDSDLPHR